ncbi:hypothetical protein Tsubulata_008679, partial [Turnera subulata]
MGQSGHHRTQFINPTNLLVITSSSLSATYFGFVQTLLLKGLVPNTYTLPYVLKACSLSQALRESQQVHGHCIKTGLSSNVYERNTLMRVYAVSGVMGNVCKVMFRAGLSPDRMTLVVVLSACGKLGDLSLGREMHSCMDSYEISVDSDVFLGNSLVDMYFKCGQAALACEVFDGMPVKNVVSWSSMIAGLAQQGEFKEALDVFRRMQSTGLKPDDVTLVAVLYSCSNLGVFELGKWVHAYVDKNNMGLLGNALVDMHAKCGNIDLALSVFNSMRCGDAYSYTALIIQHSMSSLRCAKRGYHLMSHAGLVEEGWKHFKDMSRVYNLQPQLEHYGCMVDLLGRAGLVDQALELIKNIPILPDASVVWGALLGACQIHGKVELGESVVEEVVRMEPTRHGSYILMSNIYSYASRWRDALKWRKALKEKSMKKTPPGCSLIEVDGVVHEFRKGGRSHPKIKELAQMM